jgi:hypothetical protein
VGNFFLSMNIGLLASAKAGSYLLSRRGIRFTLILSSALACAGFLYGLLKERNLSDCGRLGNFVASRCVMKMGAKAGLPYAKDLALLG